MPTQKKDLPTLIPINTKEKQTSKQKLAERNYAISCKFQTGMKIPALMREYKLSQKQVYRIIAEHAEAAKQWGASLPTHTAIVIHEMIARKSLEAIERLDALIRSAEKMGDTKLAVQGTAHLISSYFQYDNFITNGATLHETNETYREARRVIETGGSK